MLHHWCTFFNPDGTLMQTSKSERLLTVPAPSNEHSGGINYDHACPRDFASAPCVSVSTIGQGSYLCESLPIVCALLHNIGHWVGASGKDQAGVMAEVPGPPSPRYRSGLGKIISIEQISFARVPHP